MLLASRLLPAPTLWCCLLATQRPLATLRPPSRPYARQARALQQRIHASADADVGGVAEPVPAEAAALAALAKELELGMVLSSANARVKLLRKLGSRRQRERSGLILLEGHRLVSDALEVKSKRHNILYYTTILALPKTTSCHPLSSQAGHRPEAVLLTCNAVHAPEGPRLLAALRRCCPTPDALFTTAALAPALLVNQLSDTLTPQGVRARVGRAPK